MPATFTVTSTADGAATVAGTLRWAITQANASSTTVDVVAFDSAAFASPQTVTLTAGALVANGPVSIVGPAASVTLTTSTISNLLSFGGFTAYAAAVSNVAFVGGTAFQGGAVAIAYADVTITNCRFAGNTASGIASAWGGAVYADRTKSLTVVGSSFTGNTAAGGGAIGTGSFANGIAITLSDSTFTNNTASVSSGGGGGAVYCDSSVTLNVARSSFVGNRASDRYNTSYPSAAGGAIYLSLGKVVSITDSALVDNAAAASGGAVYVRGFGAGASTTLSLVNSTLARNSAGGGAAVTMGGFISTGAQVFVRNSTIARNVASTTGGAFALNQGGPAFVIDSSVIAANTSGTGYDFDDGMNAIRLPSVSHSAFGTAANVVVSAATNLLGVDVKLSPVLDVSGARPALVPLPGSPLIDAGANPLNLSTDGRGSPRQVGAGVDIGAAERQPGPQVAAAVLPTVAGTATSATVALTFADDVPLALLSLYGNTAALTVTGPAGPLAVTAATVDKLTDGTPRTVTYTVTPPGGFWDGADFGTYTVTLNGGQAKSTSGLAVPTTPLGTFTVRYAQTFAVTTTLDDGSAGSFRWAVAQANAAPQTTDTIAFAPGLTGTVTLASQVVVTDSVTVTGAGAAVTLTGAAGVLNTAGTAKVTLSDFAIRGVTATAGAALVVGTGTSATLNRMLIADNTTTADGLGGAVLNGGTLTVNDCTLSNNVGSGTGTLGGAIAGGNRYTANFTTITRSVLQGNRAASGGAVYGEFVTVEQSLVRGNFATVTGGGVSANRRLMLRNSTVVDNLVGTATASGLGGGIYLSSAQDSQIENSTIVGNTAVGPDAVGGGIGVGYLYYEGLKISSTVVAANIATSVGPDLFDGTVNGPNGYVLASSLIGVADNGFLILSETATLKGTSASPLNPQLGPLQNNGGPTLTCLPLAGCPLLDAGTNPATVAFDQRGVGYARVVGPAADIGAVEVQPPPVPDALPPVLTYVGDLYNSVRTGTEFRVIVRLTDNYAVDFATLAPADFTLTGPTGYAAVGTAVAVASVASNPTTATVSFTPPGGTITADDNGTYTLGVTGSVLDVNGLAAKTGPLGTFAVAAPVGLAGVVALLPDGTTTSLTAAGQRSTVPAIRVLFDGPATGADAAAAYKLVTGTTTVPLTVAATTVNGRTQATLTPAAPLADGRYTLTIQEANVITASAPGAIPFQGNSVSSTSTSLTFARYLADFDGDTAVDGNDLAIIGPAYNTVVGDALYRAYLDLDGDGAIDGTDLAVFAQRFNTVL